MTTTTNDDELRTIEARLRAVLDRTDVQQCEGLVDDVLDAVRAELRPLVKLNTRLISLASPLALKHDPIVREHAVRCLDAQAFVNGPRS